MRGGNTRRVVAPVAQAAGVQHPGRAPGHGEGRRGSAAAAADRAVGFSCGQRQGHGGLDYRFEALRHPLLQRKARQKNVSCQADEA